MILNTTIDEFGIPEDIEEPEGIVEITHVAVPGKPYIAPIEGMPEEMVVTGLIKESAYEIEDIGDRDIWSLIESRTNGDSEETEE